LRYLRDSLFLLQDGSGKPVTINLAPGASASFALHYPVNCPVCGRLPSYPGATRYAFTFIASEGSRAVLTVDLDDASTRIKAGTSLKRAGQGSLRKAAGSDAAGRSHSGADRAILFRRLSE
jgi:hypothetical protein